MVVFIFHVVVLFQSSCNSCYTWWTTMKRRHGPWCNAGDDGDHACVLWRWRSKAQEERPYHITYYELHVMLILYASYLA